LGRPGGAGADPPRTGADPHGGGRRHGRAVGRRACGDPGRLRHLDPLLGEQRGRHLVADLAREANDGPAGHLHPRQLRCMRVGHVPLEYYNDPEKTAATFPTRADGTRMSVLGDMARVEADGAIVLLGRGSGCINTGGEKVFPEEVEQALKSHPAVFDALVAGADDPTYGERVAAVISLRDGVDEPDPDELMAHCRTKLAGYKVPRSIVVVPEVVRSPSG